MNTNNQLIAFAIEALQRLKQKSPFFFKVWNIFNGLMALLAGIPALLIEFNITAPPVHWVDILLKLCGIAGTWGFIMGKFAVQKDPIVVDKDGKVVNDQCNVALPFTEKKEQAVADKALK